MNKSPDAFRTITEVAEWLDTPAHVLRFWESRFSQIKPVKRAGGRRYYRPTDMLLLGGIKKLLHDDCTTIKAVQSLLREQGVQHVQSLSPPVSVQVSIKKKKRVLAIKADDVQSLIDMPNVQISIKKKTPAKTGDTPQPAPAEAAKAALDPKGGPIPSPSAQPDVKPARQTDSLFDGINIEDMRDEPIDTSKNEALDAVLKLPQTLKSAAEISHRDIQDIEALYYSLKMVRNNMKRTGAAR